MTHGIMIHDDMPAGHKLLMHGRTIGQTTEPIPCGSHVHTDEAMDLPEHTISGRLTAAQVLRHDEFVLTKLHESA